MTVKILPAIIGLTGIVTTSAQVGMPQQKSNDPHYNILWLSCEDINPGLGCYGAAGVKTPNLDKLAAEGIRYTHAYSTVGVCAPSRSSIITGMYPVSIGTQNMRTGPHWAYRPAEKETYETYWGVRDIRGRNVPQYAAVLLEEVKCFPEYLRAAGYFCTNNAKTDYQFNAPITAWDECNNQAHWRNRPDGMPFFSVFNFEVTHESRIWMKKNDPMLADTAAVRIPAYYPDIPVVRKDVSRNYSNIMELDQQIGAFLDSLKKDGLLDKTIIVFWSDHGGPLLRQKRDVGNAGLHVPLIIRFPDKRMAGTVDDRLVSLMDLGPTMMSLAGIKPPAYMQGKPFLGKYAVEKPHEYIFGSADRFDEAVDMRRSAIDGRFVYIRNFYPELPLIFRNQYREQIDMTHDLIEMNRLGELHGDASYIWMQTKPAEELYDLSTDPDEVHNLAGNSEYAAKLKELRKALSHWQLEVGDKGFIPERDLVEMMWPGGIQPNTKPVSFHMENNCQLVLSSETPGASIAYQVGDSIGKQHWSLYHGPVKMKSGESIRAVSIRIGYRQSEKTTFMMSEK